MLGVTGSGCCAPRFVITGLNTVAEAAGVSADKGSSVNVGLLQDVTEFDLVSASSKNARSFGPAHLELMLTTSKSAETT